MICKNPDTEWEKFGKEDAYFGVLSEEKYRKRNLTEKAKEEFFETGRNHIRNVIEVTKRFLDKDFAPTNVLDFGCGVGRLVIAFSEVAESVVGLDVSDSMLEEAHNNCKRRSINNVIFIKSDDNLSSLDGQFDLIHSFIVFQHIPVKRGMYIFTKLLNHLADDGVCAIQFIYFHSVLGKNFRLPSRGHSNIKLLKNFKGGIKRYIRTVCSLFKTMQDLSVEDYPEMQMNLYNLDEIFSILQLRGITNIHVDFTDHQGILGCFLYFKKPRKTNSK